MSRARAEEVDTSLLAAQGAALERRFPLSDFDRLRGLLAEAEGEVAREVRARFRFAREQERAVALVEVEARLPLVCQRCLRTLEWPIKSSSRLAFVDAADAGGSDIGGRDTFETHAGHVELAAVVEEELLLALPLVANHAMPADCATLAAAQPAPGAASTADTTQRPFAGLRELLDRK
jgi:uncharacterized protein